jgi:hypothetical protein
MDDPIWAFVFAGLVLFVSVGLFVFLVELAQSALG